MRRAVAIVDGDHTVAVMRHALASLPYDVVAVWLAGGTEKLRAGDDFGVPTVDELADAFARVELVVDLSDEPVLDPRTRFGLVARTLAAGLSYVGSDFRFDPPQLEPFSAPSIGVIGTGKRVGKTAVSAHVARTFARDRDVIVVTMGRGGPSEPELVERPPTIDFLLALSREGRHAASDHLEIAAAAGIPTIGCRRAGGGLVGAVTSSNVLEGAALAASRAPDLTVFDGSGGALPPVAVDRRILVVGDGHDATVGLNAYRVLVSDLVVAVGAVDHGAIRDVKDVPIVRAELRLRPLAPLEGRRAAVFTTGAAPTEHLDADVVAVSRNLGDRARLRADLERVEADVYVVELKAAAIDVVAETAAERGVELVLATNDVVSPELDEELAELVAEETYA
ncbi:MAG TPA: hypothetical protein VEH52_09000 [Gaiellaceae bacterium]|jgi:cyclic 2,3-diphosphoglycerate synthetase|nr:hypothetical protein [Gaiellaceae bacterium]